MSAKKKELTPEEMLQEALVPEEEQPYKVPENWVWVRLGIIYNLVKEDFDPSKNEQMPYIGLEHLAKGGGIIEVSNTDSLKSNKTLFAPGDVLYGKLRPYLNKHVCIDFKGVVSTDIIVLRSKGIFSNCLLDKYLNLPIVINHTVNNSKGINLPRVSPQAVLNMPVPVPPLYEQKRIVSRVESLLDKINQAKELIVEARETFADRRAAILTKAFRGELTKKWREQNPNPEPAEKLLERIREEKTKLGIKQVKYLPVEPPYELPEDWSWVRISELYKVTGGGTPSKAVPQFWGGSIPWVSPKDMKTRYIYETIDNITKEGLENSSAKLVKKGSIALVVRSGILQHTLPVAIIGAEAAVNQDLKVLDSGSEEINKYLFWYIVGHEKYLLKTYTKSGTTVKSIIMDEFINHIIPLPPMLEINQIIEIINQCISKEENAFMILENIENIEITVQKILSKAFRGQLGTNDQNEESAMELLKEVIAKPANDASGKTLNGVQ